MRYLKIRAKTYNEAMMKLKMDHGDDAIPISHKYVKEGGFFNSRFFASDVVELTAAVQERKPAGRMLTGKRNLDITVGARETAAPADETRKRVQPVEKKSGSEGEFDMDSLSKTIDSLNENLNGFRSERQAGTGRTSGPVPEIAEPETRLQPGDDPDQFRKFEKEFSEIKETLNRLVREKSEGQDPVLTGMGAEEPHMKQFIDLLRKNDFDKDECNSIINEVRNSISRDDRNDRFKIEKSLKDLLKSRIVISAPIKRGNKKKIVMFVGPTGVGKTTTMAKLGALHSLREGQRVAFVTIDNYRIAATEQLKKYAEIMRIPIYSVNNQKEFREVIAREKAEIIMVDTSGRSHRNELKLSEIKSFADTVEYDFQKILCVSANTKKTDLNDVFRAFDTIQFDSIIITKVDETSFIGNVVGVADKYNKPISYFTNGQEVPNDIVAADPDKIVDLMIGDINN